MRFRWAARVLALSGCLAGGGSVVAQSTPAAPPTAPPSPPSTPATPATVPAQEPGAEPLAIVPAGQVLFQSHGEPPAPAAVPVDPNRKLLPLPERAPAQESTPETAAEKAAGPELSDQERGALLFTGYDLDARVTPVGGKLTMRARVTVRNRSEEPLARIALQVSSSLTWESVSLVGAGGAQALSLAQHLIDTDADHTGKAREAVLELPAPLAPGAALTLDTFYSGSIVQSGDRLTRIGASDAQGASADWDTIAPGGVWLRGFGNVLWYPVSAPQMFLGEGTRLFDAVDQTKLQEQTATMRLRLSVEYAGEPPIAAYFCGRRAAFTVVGDVPDEPIATGSGVATAEFEAEPLGFRVPNLFVLPRPETMAAPLGGNEGGEPMLAVAATDPVAEGAIPALAMAAQRVVPVLQQWLGTRPLSALTVLDRVGQPFQDGPLLVAPVTSLTTSTAEPALTFSLAHAWVQTGRPWVDEGLAQFFALLQIEQTGGRDAMVAQLGELLKPLTQPEASPTAEEEAAKARNEPLIRAASEVYYRRKAAAVWLMLREIVGDQALQITLGAWRQRSPAKISAEEDALVLEAMLEKNSEKDLHHFFDDWVLHDRGLPDLSLADVSPREMPTTLSGRSGGWLTTLTVHNAGDAMADVPVAVSAGSFSTTVRLQVPAGANATARVQTEAAPTEVTVNDGITPEMRTSVHRRAVRGR